MNEDTGPSYSGGDGSSLEKAVQILGAHNTSEGIAAEYRFIELLHGPRGREWIVEGQWLMRGENEGRVDKIVIELRSGEKRTYFFDITDFFGKL